MRVTGADGEGPDGVAGRRGDARAVAKAVGAGRIALGASYLLAPNLALRAWPGTRPGPGADGALLRMLARSTGGRDVALGVGALLAVSHGGPVRGWLEAAMLADVVDAAAILVAFRHLPRARASFMVAAALATAVAGRRLAASVG